MGAREERLAQNEALFREVNERVAEVATHFIDVETKGEAVEFICECGRRDCAEPITMTVAEYQAIRADGTRFAVIPGHQLPEVESVVERHPTYVVVREARGGCSRDRTRDGPADIASTPGQRPGVSSGASAARPDNKGIHALPSKGAVPGRWFPRAAVASSSIVPAPRSARAQDKNWGRPGSASRVSRTAGAAEGTAACADRGEEETFGSPPFRTQVGSAHA